MARKSVPLPIDVEPAGAARMGDAGMLLDQWFEVQRALFGAGLSQLTESQQLLFRSWLQLIDAWSAPLTPFYLRGGEQLA